MSGRRRRHGWGALLLGVVTLAAVGCVPSGRPPVLDRSPVFETRPDTYVVRPGDTLYAIAWRYQMDYRSLASSNGIRAPYTIYPGQRIRLDPAPQAAEPAAPRAEVPTRPSTRASIPPAPTALPTAGWQPPTQAAVQRGFGDGNRGIEYRLGATDRILAANGGEVVYAGSGLGGYRHLVIIKHDPQYLSAYSFDRALAVREGQRIEAGGGVALASGADRASRLRFEVRRNGDPVNPGLLIGR